MPPLAQTHDQEKGCIIGVVSSDVLLWVGFNAFILAMLAIDLGLFHRDSHEVTTKEATGWTIVWVSLAMTFNAILYFWKGPGPALEFMTGYLIEYSLSVDNIFVFIMLFSYFNVPSAFRHKVLFWGILGALIMRAALIVAGATLIAKFHWMIYLFGAFLIFTGIKMAFSGDDGVEPDHNPVVKWFRRVFPVTGQFEGQNFFVRHGGKLMATPLFIVLLVVETTDVMFALDSIPAIFAVTRDPFLVYTSNVFAILGLRSLYFLLSGVLGLFRYLKYGLSGVLTFVGVKMVITDLWHVSTGVSLGVVAGILFIAVVASVLIKEKKDDDEDSGHGGSSAKDDHSTKMAGAKH